MKTLVQNQTEIQSCRLPLAIEQSLKRKLLEAAVKLGRELSPAVLDAVLQSVARNLSQPQTLPDSLVSTLSPYLERAEVHAVAEALTQMQQVTQLQPDDLLLEQTARLFVQLGVDPDVALDWARLITPGYTPSRPITDEEQQAIERLLSAPRVEDLVEAGLQASGSGSSRPDWVRLFADNSLLTAAGVVLILSLSHLLIWQAAFVRGVRLEALRSQRQQERIIRWANCVAAGGRNCLAQELHNQGFR